jgi:hypothetical protein
MQICWVNSYGELRRLVAGFPPRRPGFEPRSGLVGLVVDKVALVQVFSDCFGFPCQFSFHQMLHNHPHLSSWAGITGQLMADVPSGLSLPPLTETKKQKKNYACRNRNYAACYEVIHSWALTRAVCTTISVHCPFCPRRCINPHSISLLPPFLLKNKRLHICKDFDPEDRGNFGNTAYIRTTQEQYQHQYYEVLLKVPLTDSLAGSKGRKMDPSTNTLIIRVVQSKTMCRACRTHGRD